MEPFSMDFHETMPAWLIIIIVAETHCNSLLVHTVPFLRRKLVMHLVMFAELQHPELVWCSILLAQPTQFGVVPSPRMAINGDD